MSRRSGNASGVDLVAQHLDRLSDCIPGAKDPQTGKPQGAFAAFAREVEQQARAHLAPHERLGRREWRRYDNAAWAPGSLAKACVHVALDSAIHDDADIDLALTVSYHAHKANEALAELRRKRSGTPHPVFDDEPENPEPID